MCCGKNFFQDVHNVTDGLMNFFALCASIRNYESKFMLIMLGLIGFDHIS